MAYTTWKGSATEYKTLHWRIAKKFGKTRLCENCDQTEGKFEWANLSGEYLEVRSDWKRLCAKCHKKLDAASYEGKRFSGRTHKEESRLKTAMAMRKYWAENRDKMMAVQPRGRASGRYKHGKYVKEAK